MDDDNSLPIYSEDYQPSFKVMHGVITKFAEEMDCRMEKKIARLQMQAEWSARMQKKEQRAINGDEHGHGVDETMAIGDESDDGELSDSEYEPKIYLGKGTILKHKGFNYRGSKSKTTHPLMDLPECKYKCRAKDCSGTVEPTLKRNGRVHIRPIDIHSCK